MEINGLIQQMSKKKYNILKFQYPPMSFWDIISQSKPPQFCDFVLLAKSMKFSTALENLPLPQIWTGMYCLSLEKFHQNHVNWYYENLVQKNENSKPRNWALLLLGLHLDSPPPHMWLKLWLQLLLFLQQWPFYS